ncbi:NAD(P)/FAD-dependent oxidoreductase [Paenibacillus agricola]|uniref:NAD(P)/FAD-dependent oxidoreductase n=1 Tax=Paenibacillus agricola TaxID=2716264 RepID=A0ABX0JGU8_9BACL|nr:NAD(P)/FAD-dependent oxidoreductase [Paenibacillus agricola]NHN33913.1 NAD(P)/FAD-dependent oxidoreductase [Paenibacillus agricola]
MYDCVIVGGGIAGLQAAIQLGRYKHRILVIDKGEGRSTLCRSYHNILGWPEGVSGEELRRLGSLQGERLGVQFMQAEVTGLKRRDSSFILEREGRQPFIEASTVLLATGLSDRFPDLPGLRSCLGLTVYVCPDCDGYEVDGRKTIVMGSGNVGASMALALLYWTKDVVYINHEWEREATDSRQLLELQAHGIRQIDASLSEVLVNSATDGEFQGVRLADGRVVAGERGFIAFGRNHVHSELARQIGIQCLDNKHIITDPRSKMTNVPRVWAAGDVGVHAEQLTIAMGEGSQAAIWIHKELLGINARPLGLS